MANRKQRRALAKVQPTPGSRVTSLADVAARLTQPMPSQQTAADPSAGIVQGNGADYFGPQNPMRPQASEEVKGRQLDYPVAYNLDVSVRPYEAIKFPDLRALADNCDLLRLAIETRKDQMEKLNWSIKPRTRANGDSMIGADAPIIQEITDALQYPDRVCEWGVWLRKLLEDLFVIDAPTLYCRQTRGGKLWSLEPVDGATIKLIIDDWGRTPKPPVPAYQQLIKGMPANNYTTDEMIYLPRNPRSSRVYGYSPTEQVLMTVNILLRRQLFQSQWYSEGNMPEAVIGTPEDWSPNQIAEFQKNWDAMLAGNQAARRKGMFVPGGVGKSFQLLKEPDLTGKMDEWLARVVCFAFSLSPQPFVSMMNRATAETSHDAALSEGLAPLMSWVKRLVDKIILKYWGTVDVSTGIRVCPVEFEWTDDREVDAVAQMTTLSVGVSKGIYKINEARDILGLTPDPDGDTLRCLTAAGYVKVGASDDAPPPGTVPPVEPGGKPGTPPVAAGSKGKPKPGEEAQAAKLARPFRDLRKAKKLYYATPRHDPSHQGGAGG